jgi:hypothetical protein
VVFYEMLTGGLPLGHFARPSQKAAVDVRVDGVVLRALEKEPERWYQQAGEMRTALDALTGDTPTTTVWAAPPRRPELSEPERKEVRRRLAGPVNMLIPAGLLACVAGLGLCTLSWAANTHPAVPGLSPPGLTILAAASLLGVVQGVFIIVGALAMQRLQTYQFARLGSVLALLPLTPAVLIGLPVGIWALAVLGEPGVRSAFAGEQGEGAGRQPDWLARVAGFFGSTTGWATILCLVGLLACLSPWAYVFTGPGPWNQELVNGFGTGHGIAVLVTFLGLSMFLLATGFLQPIPLWRPETLIGAGLAVVLLMGAFFKSFPSPVPEFLPGAYITFAAGLGLLLVGSIQLRGVLMRLHAARGARPDETASTPRRR